MLGLESSQNLDRGISVPGIRCNPDIATILYNTRIMSPRPPCLSSTGETFPRLRFLDGKRWYSRFHIRPVQFHAFRYLRLAPRGWFPVLEEVHFSGSAFRLAIPGSVSPQVQRRKANRIYYKIETDSSEFEL
jgi:hypothetical protein